MKGFTDALLERVWTEYQETSKGRPRDVFKKRKTHGDQIEGRSWFRILSNRTRRSTQTLPKQETRHTRKDAFYGGHIVYRFTPRSNIYILGPWRES